MRVYYMRDGHIHGVEFLKGSTDEERIAEARELYEGYRLGKGTDGFEVWEGARFIYRWPEPVRQPNS